MEKTINKHYVIGILLLIAGMLFMTLSFIMDDFLFIRIVLAILSIFLNGMSIGILYTSIKENRKQK